jgi:hypothetical protein
LSIRSDRDRRAAWRRRSRDAHGARLHHRAGRHLAGDAGRVRNPDLEKVPGAIGKALDAKIALIRDQLAEAETLRKEAEALKAEYEAKSLRPTRTARRCSSARATRPTRSSPRRRPMPRR